VYAIKVIPTLSFYHMNTNRPHTVIFLIVSGIPVIHTNYNFRSSPLYKLYSCPRNVEQGEWLEINILSSCNSLLRFKACNQILASRSHVHWQSETSSSQLLGVPFGQHFASFSLFWPSKPGLSLKISSYPNSSQSRIDTDL
jgi:hypothetical protein